MYRPEPTDAFPHDSEMFRCCPECLYDWDECECDDDEYEYEDDEYESDGQPTEYEEWQDYMGGDDWDHGQYDCEW